MNEHSFVKSIHRKLPKEIYVWKIADRYSGGVPDAMYAGPNGILFIEYKFVKALPKKPETLIKTTLSPLQTQWITRMQNWNHSVLLVIGFPDKTCLVMNSLTNIISRAYYDLNQQSTSKLIRMITEQTLGIENANSDSSTKFKTDLGR